MSAIQFLSGAIWQRLGLTLLHFLWQGLVVAVVVWLIVRLFRPRRGTNRYAAYLLAFVVMAACPIVTFLVVETPIVIKQSGEALMPDGLVGRSDAPSLAVHLGTSTGDTQPSAAPGPGSDLTAPARTTPLPLRERMAVPLRAALPWAVAGWLIGVFALSLRLLLGFVGICRWRRRLEPLPESLREHISSLAERLGMRGGLRVFISPSALQAMTVGLLRPMVLVPASMLAQVTPEMLQAIIAHELSHIRRLDLWVNLFQRIVETLLFYHPAVWWVSNRLRSERELCCDDMAVRATGERLTYASALERAGRARLTAKQNSLAVGLSQRKGLILARVRHVLGILPAAHHSRCWIAGLVALATTVALASTTVISYSSQRSAREEAGAAPRQDQARVLHFPTDRSLGTLQVQDESVVRRIRSYYFHTEDGHVWEHFAPAMGDVAVPAGKRVKLIVNRTGARDLMALSALQPDDLYALHLGGEGVGDDRCMPYIGHLTGLRVLDLFGSAVTDDALRYLRGLASLERLSTPAGTSTEGLAHIARLPALRGLYIRSPRLTREGFSHIARMTSLEELAILEEPRRQGIDYTGLPQLAGLPSLTYLSCNAPNDAAMAYIGKLRSLRNLNLGGSMISDAGMAHLANLTNLETLALYKVGGITGASLVYLKPLRSLKQLNVSGMQMSREHLAHLEALQALERLELPYSCDTDEVLADVAQLDGLKYLWIGNHGRSRISDAGLAHLRRLRSLEELYIGGTGITNEGMSHIAELTNLKAVSVFVTSPLVNDEGLARLNGLTSLTRLSLPYHGARITISGLSHLNAFPHLTELDTHGIVQDNSGLNIAGLTKLKRLFLYLEKDSSLRDEDLACLAGLKRLGWLQMGHCKGVTDAGAAHLAGLTSIWRLHMRDSDLTDDGLSYLANMKALQNLQVGGSFTDDGLRHLEGLQALQSVGVRSANDISPAALEGLRNELPNLYSLDYSFEAKSSRSRSERPQPRRGAAAAGRSPLLP